MFIQDLLYTFRHTVKSKCKLTMKEVAVEMPSLWSKRTHLLSN